MGNNESLEEKEYDSTRRVEEYLKKYNFDEKKYSNSAKLFRNEFFLGLNQKIHDKVFFDNGRDSRKPYKPLEELRNAMVDAFFDTTVSDPQNDRIILSFLDEMKKKYSMIIPSNESSREVLEEKILNLSRHFISEVISFFGGLNFKIIEPRCGETIKRLKRERDSNIIYLGEMKGFGVCRHRVILFKLLCDTFSIPCRILRGWMEFGNRKGAHAWNEIVLKNQSFVVDTMNFDDIVDPSQLRTSEGQLVRYVNLGHPHRSLEIQKETIDNIKKLFTENRGRNLRTGKHLGQGAFGIVYEILGIDCKYEEPSDDERKRVIRIVRKILAVKEVNLNQLGVLFNEERKQRIKRMVKRELEMMTLFQHPNIVKVIGSFSTFIRKKTIVRLVMEKYEMNGLKFLEELEDEEIGTPDHKTIEVLIFLLEICKGLSFIHSFGIVHFDIKPHNILLNWNKEQQYISNVVISDFGSSKEEKMNLNLTSSPTITRDFAAPEILEIIEKKKKNEPIDSSFVFSTKSDIYSFGVLMGFFLKYLKDYPILEIIQQKCLSKIIEERPEINEIKEEIYKIIIFQNIPCDLYTWGNGSSYKLGHGDESDEFFPRFVSSLSSKKRGIEILAFILEKLPVEHVNLNTLKTIQGMVESIKPYSNLWRLVYVHILFNFRLWVRNTVSVQNELFDYLIQKIRKMNRYRMKRMIGGIEKLVDALRIFYFYEGEKENVSLVVTEKRIRNINDLMILRNKIKTLIKLFLKVQRPKLPPELVSPIAKKTLSSQQLSQRTRIFRSRNPNNFVSEHEVEVILAFLINTKDQPMQQNEILLLLYELLDEEKTEPNLVFHMSNLERFIRPFITVLKENRNENVRLLYLKIITKVMEKKDEFMRKKIIPYHILVKTKKRFGGGVGGGVGGSRSSTTGLLRSKGSKLSTGQKRKILKKYYMDVNNRIELDKLLFKMIGEYLMMYSYDENVYNVLTELMFKKVLTFKLINTNVLNNQIRQLSDNNNKEEEEKEEEEEEEGEEEEEEEGKKMKKSSMMNRMEFNEKFRYLRIQSVFVIDLFLSLLSKEERLFESRPDSEIEHILKLKEMGIEDLYKLVKCNPENRNYIIHYISQFPRKFLHLVFPFRIRRRRFLHKFSELEKTSPQHELEDLKEKKRIGEEIEESKLSVVYSMVMDSIVLLMMEKITKIFFKSSSTLSSSSTDSNNNNNNNNNSSQKNKNKNIPPTSPSSSSSSSSSSDKKLYGNVSQEYLSCYYEKEIQPFINNIHLICDGVPDMNFDLLVITFYRKLFPPLFDILDQIVNDIETNYNNRNYSHRRSKNIFFDDLSFLYFMKLFFQILDDFKMFALSSFKKNFKRKVMLIEYVVVKFMTSFGRRIINMYLSRFGAPSSPVPKANNIQDQYVPYILYSYEKILYHSKFSKEKGFFGGIIGGMSGMLSNPFSAKVNYIPKNSFFKVFFELFVFLFENVFQQQEFEKKKLVDLFRYFLFFDVYYSKFNIPKRRKLQEERKEQDIFSGETEEELFNKLMFYDHEMDNQQTFVSRGLFIITILCSKMEFFRNNMKTLMVMDDQDREKRVDNKQAMSMNKSKNYYSFIPVLKAVIRKYLKEIRGLSSSTGKKLSFFDPKKQKDSLLSQRPDIRKQSIQMANKSIEYLKEDNSIGDFMIRFYEDWGEILRGEPFKTVKKDIQEDTRKSLEKYFKRIRTGVMDLKKNIDKSASLDTNR